MHTRLPVSALIGALLILLCGQSGPRIDSRANIERAVALIDEGKYSLARAYLDPALIDYRLSAGERSRGYYLRGYSFLAEEYYVSAGKDYYRSLEFKPDNPVALAAVAHLHSRGLGVTRDAALAYQLFSQAARTGHASAQLQVAIAELHGVGTTRDVTSARRWLQNLADQGYTAALADLARSYRTKITDDPNPELAKSWYERAWAAGDPDGLLGLAFMHRNGEFGLPDIFRAQELFQQAAAAGSGAAQVSVGYMHLMGEGVPQDYARALVLFRQAAELKTPSSYLWLGHMYQAGLGLAADLPTALRWYRKGAVDNIPAARLRMIYLLLASDDAGDHHEALENLAGAAQTGKPAAHNDYAWVLATHPSSALRNGMLALQLAKKAVAAEPSPTYLDTLAAAHAEVGNFAEAVTIQQRALDALDDEQAEFASEFTAHLAEYLGSQPWRE